jgi:hypothetical protein
MLDPTRNVAKKTVISIFMSLCGEGPSKNVIFKIVLIQQNVFNKDRHNAKSLTFLKNGIIIRIHL